MRFSWLFDPSLISLGVLGKAAAVMILILIGGNAMFEKIDITSLAIPDEYLPVMLIAVLIAGVFGVGMVAKKWKRNSNAVEGDKETKWYVGADVAAMIVGMGAGMFGAIPFVDAIFIGAGMWTYALFANLIALAVGVGALYIFHYGLRELILKSAWYLKDTAKAVAEASEDVKEAKDIVAKIEVPGKL